jgi:hypothetical protein
LTHRYLELPDSAARRFIPNATAYRCNVKIVGFDVTSFSRRLNTDFQMPVRSSISQAFLQSARLVAGGTDEELLLWTVVNLRKKKSLPAVMTWSSMWPDDLRRLFVFVVILAQLWIADEHRWHQEREANSRCEAWGRTFFPTLTRSDGVRHYSARVQKDWYAQQTPHTAWEIAFFGTSGHQGGRNSVKQLLGDAT